MKIEILYTKKSKHIKPVAEAMARWVKTYAKSIDDFDILVREIESMSLNKLEAYNLISKIMIWDVSKGDF